MGVFQILSFLVVMAIVALLLFVLFKGAFSGVPFLNNHTGSNLNLSYTSVTTQVYVTHNQTIAYALSLINQDRAKFGLAPVSLSNETSAQQHSDSMLSNKYFSHWDIYGMKPYMRYTLLGGRGAVSENIAYLYNSSGISVFNAIKTMEYNFMYNDAACCNNGHRDNILNQYHNQVSIGVIYNDTSVYFTEDFIDNYIQWIGGTPLAFPNDTVALKGVIAGGYSLSSVQIAYDQPPRNITPAALGLQPYNGSYSYGPIVAGLGYTKGNSYYYYDNITTINATEYAVSGQNFNVAFNLTKLDRQYGAGVYTVLVNLDNGTKSPFLGSTYSIFINSQGHIYTPTGV
jgi:uncharacterized protein YkwD